ncbi:unnamed protein product [Cyprideis torosa]|uniref:Uncharacterized protein n=1 Tax=Cyprideis torosa TaxID=163714 RepID=A0A7R8W9C9_9CRUS|nr:unnamed protein product [Cyprideis torosa]CAG0889642.1 unnamed protein product [Cyprideis torosa]
MTFRMDNKRDNTGGVFCWTRCASVPPRGVAPPAHREWAMMENGGVESKLDDNCKCLSLAQCYQLLWTRGGAQRRFPGSTQSSFALNDPPFSDGQCVNVSAHPMELHCA